jgi:hypothetical protein
MSMMQQSNFLLTFFMFVTPFFQFVFSLILAIWFFSLWNKHKHVFLLWFAIGIGVVPLIATLSLPILTQLIFSVFGIGGMIPVLIRQGGILFFGLIEVVCIVIAIIKLTEYLKNNSEKASV